MNVFAESHAQLAQLEIDVFASPFQIDP